MVGGSVSVACGSAGLIATETLLVLYAVLNWGSTGSCHTGGVMSFTSTIYQSMCRRPGRLCRNRPRPRMSSPSNPARAMLLMSISRTSSALDSGRGNQGLMADLSSAQAERSGLQGTRGQLLRVADFAKPDGSTMAPVSRHRATLPQPEVGGQSGLLV